MDTAQTRTFPGRFDSLASIGEFVTQAAEAVGFDERVAKARNGWWTSRPWILFEKRGGDLSIQKRLYFPHLLLWKRRSTMRRRELRRSSVRSSFA